MSVIAWSPEYSVGIQSIDAQHQRLFALVDELFVAMSKGQGNEILGEILKTLYQYTLTHFSTEERYMSQYGYQGLTQHKAEHDKLTAQVKQLFDDHSAGKPIFTTNLINFLKNWLINHILKTDMKYRDFLVAKGIR